MRAKKNRQPSQETSVCLADTPLGHVLLSFTANGLAALEFAREDSQISLGPPPLPVLEPMISAVVKELQAFFAGEPADFSSLPLDLQGTPFQKKVWQELRRLPRGSTISYRELAARVGHPKASRAVGQANAVNPVPIIVPCHRVISADGRLGGYSSGPERKRWLLRHEGAL